MIDIFFIRHGQTDGNASKRHQPNKTRLTLLGRQQAAGAAEKIAKLKPTHFITSTRVRAVETASIIGAVIDIIPETNDLFVELERPKHISGYHHSSSQSLWYLFTWYLGFKKGIEGEEAGESYQSFRVRLKQARQYLETLPAGSRVVVVSHAVFITMFISHMSNGKRISFLKALKTLLNILRIKNGSITHLEYAPELVNKESPWRFKRK